MCATVFFLPHVDVICDLLLNRRTATWNLFVKQNMSSLANQTTSFVIERQQIYINTRQKHGTCLCIVSICRENMLGYVSPSLPVPRSEQFAKGTLFGQNIRANFRANGGYCVHYPSNIFATRTVSIQISIRKKLRLDICPPILFVPRSEQFSKNEARGKLRAFPKRSSQRTNIRASNPSNIFVRT